MNRKKSYALVTAVAMFSVAGILFTQTSDEPVDGDWLYRFGFDNYHAGCASFVEPGQITIKSGRIRGELPFLLSDDIRLEGRVDESVTGVWEYDGVIFTLYMDLEFSDDSATGRWSLPDLGCQGPVRLARGALPPKGSDASAEDRLDELRKLLERGLITEDEAARKRKEILDAL